MERWFASPRRPRRGPRACFSSRICGAAARRILRRTARPAFWGCAITTPGLISCAASMKVCADEVAGILQSMEAVLGLESKLSTPSAAAPRMNCGWRSKALPRVNPLRSLRCKNPHFWALPFRRCGCRCVRRHCAAAELTYGLSRIYHPEAGLVEQYHQIGAVYAQLLPRAREISRIIGED